MAGTKKDFTDDGYCQYSLGTLGVTTLFNIPVVGADLVNTTVEAVFVTPARMKISAIGIAFTAIDSIAGTDAFNIVVGSGAYTQGVTVQNDNATLPYYNHASTAEPVQIAGGGSGITTDFALPGQALFAADVAFTVANFPNITALGGVAAAIGDVPTAESNIVLAASDAVFQRGQIITLRLVTTASTGSITNLVVTAVTEVRPLNWPPDPAQVQPGQTNTNGQIQGFVNPTSVDAVRIQNVRPVSGVTF